nr:hypothetical protein [Morchella crassipes]
MQGGGKGGGRRLHLPHSLPLTSSRDANPPEPPWRPRRGPPWVLMGTPQHSSHPAATQREGGRSPPSCIPPPYGGGDASPLLLLLGRARVARPPKQKWNRPRPSFLFSIKNWKEESWKRAKRGGRCISPPTERETLMAMGGGPQERGRGPWLGGGRCRQGVKNQKISLYPPPAPSPPGGGAGFIIYICLYI